MMCNPANRPKNLRAAACTGKPSLRRASSTRCVSTFRSSLQPASRSNVHVVSENTGLSSTDHMTPSVRAPSLWWQLSLAPNSHALSYQTLMGQKSQADGPFHNVIMAETIRITEVKADLEITAAYQLRSEEHTS